MYNYDTNYIHDYNSYGNSPYDNFYRQRYSLDNDDDRTVNAECANILFLIWCGFSALIYLNRNEILRNLFSNNDNTLTPLSCTYKYLFNYTNNEDLIEQINKAEVENKESQVECDEETDEETEVECDEETDEVECEECEECEETEVECEECEECEECDEETDEECDEETINYIQYNELFNDNEFKVVLLNFLKNKDLTKNEKYKSIIENLEKDILEYVYVDLD